MLPFFGCDFLFPHYLDRIVLPLVDDVSSGFAVLKPKVEPTKGIALVHFCEDCSILIVVGGLDPATVAEGLVPRRILESLELDEPIASARYRLSGLRRVGDI